jgi:hypothetical protein
MKAPDGKNMFLKDGRRLLFDSRPESYKPLPRAFFCFGICGIITNQKGELWKRSFLGI